MLNLRSALIFVVLLISAVHGDDGEKAKQGRNDSSNLNMTVNGDTEKPIEVTTLIDNGTVTTAAPPITTSTTTPTTIPTEPTTSKPTTTASTPTTSTTTTTPSTTVTTTIPSTTNPVTTTTSKSTAKPVISTTEIPPAPHKDRHFDGASFIGGIVLAVGLMGIGFIAFKFYKARAERNYHTL